MKKPLAALALVAMCAACKPAPPPPAPVPTPTPVPVGSVETRYHMYLAAHYPAGSTFAAERCQPSMVAGMSACSATVSLGITPGTQTDRAACPSGTSGACKAQ